MDDQSGAAAGDDKFTLLARLTARLASTARLDEIVDAVVEQIVVLGFGAVWMAVLDERTGNLRTLKSLVGGLDITHEMGEVSVRDLRQPVGHAFHERRTINIVDPSTLVLLDSDDQPVPPDRLAIARNVYDRIQGHPFANVPLLGSRGQPVGVIGLGSYHGNQRIPDEVLSEGLLRAFMDHLGIAMERALHIARLEHLNAELVNAQATIIQDERIKAVGELAAAVAHDLNNLANVALLATSIGERSPTDAFHVLPRIARANRAIGELVARLQRVARIGTHTTTSDDVANVPLIVEDVLALVSPILRERGIAIVLDLAPVPVVRADPVLVHRIVLNLVLNAQDALARVAQEQRWIRIATRETTTGVCLEVRDRGPGISPEVLATLFQPFVTTKPGHAGLGLAAAQASLRHFGGHITAHNASDGGAAFEVTFLRAARATGVAPAVTPEAPVTHRTAKILVVDDDPDIVFVVRSYLEQFGFEIHTASDADAAIALAAHERFDLVLCDVGLPNKSGLDAFEALHGAGFHGKFVLMTGWDSASVRTDARAAEADLILTKPFVGEELLRAIDQLLAVSAPSSA